MVTEDVFACIVFPSEEKASTSEEWAVIMGVWTRKKKCRVVVCSLECFVKEMYFCGSPLDVFYHLFEVIVWNFYG